MTLLWSLQLAIGTTELHSRDNETIPLLEDFLLTSLILMLPPHTLRGIISKHYLLNKYKRLTGMKTENKFVILYGLMVGTEF